MLLVGCPRALSSARITPSFCIDILIRRCLDGDPIRDRLVVFEDIRL
jgi:hypothetical protein